ELEDDFLKPTRTEKRQSVESSDSSGSAHVQDTSGDASETAAESLGSEVSAEVSEAVGDFMEQAAQQNEAAADEIPDVKNKPGSYISFEHVDKAFGDFVVLEDVNFCVNSGETLCILGRSGVGKSVTLQMLMGFLKPDNGEIRVAGENICGFSEKELQRIRQKVTMVFQNG